MIDEIYSIIIRERDLRALPCVIYDIILENYHLINPNLTIYINSVWCQCLFPKMFFFPKFVTRLALFDYIMNIGWHRMMSMNDLGIATRTVWYIRKGRWLEINSFPSFQHTIIISHNRVILWICNISNIICMRFAAVCFGLHTLQFS